VAAATHNSPVVIRPETPRDVDGIRQVNIAAFEHHPISHQTEHLIVDALRSANALELSLVADDAGEVVGHIAFSPAVIRDATSGWFLVGPVAVLPRRQGEGIGRALVEAGLEELRSRAALGCVLVGDPAFYRRFGFQCNPGVTYPGVPDDVVLCLPLSAEAPVGDVVANEAFSIEA
jgi:putative acetyltransferase